MENDKIIKELLLYIRYHQQLDIEVMQYVHSLHARLEGTPLGTEIGCQLVDLERRGIVTSPTIDLRNLGITPDVIARYSHEYAQHGYAPFHFIK